MKEIVVFSPTSWNRLGLAWCISQIFCRKGGVSVVGSPSSQARPGHQGAWPRSSNSRWTLGPGLSYGVSRCTAPARVPCGVAGHDDEGAVQPHHPVYRSVQVVVIQIGAGRPRIKRYGPGFGRWDGPGGDPPRGMDQACGASSKLVTFTVILSPEVAKIRGPGQSGGTGFGSASWKIQK